MKSRLQRVPGWEGWLDVFLRSRARRRFSWGVNDCCLFACDAVLVMTGTDIARGFRDLYTTRAGACRAILNAGASSVGELADMIAVQHDLRVVPAGFAQRGDVVLLRRELGESLGIVSLTGVEIWAPSDEGLVEVPFREAQRAWRI